MVNNYWLEIDVAGYEYAVGLLWIIIGHLTVLSIS